MEKHFAHPQSYKLNVSTVLYQSHGYPLDEMLLFWQAVSANFLPFYPAEVSSATAAAAANGGRCTTRGRNTRSEGEGPAAMGIKLYYTTVTGSRTVSCFLSTAAFPVLLEIFQALRSRTCSQRLCSDRQTHPSALSVVAFSWLTVRWASAAPRRPLISIPWRRRRQQVTGPSKGKRHSHEIPQGVRLLHVEVAKTRQRCSIVSCLPALAGRMWAPVYSVLLASLLKTALVSPPDDD